MGKRRRRPPVPRNSRGGSPSSRRPAVSQARPMVADRGAGPAGNAAAGRARRPALAPSRGTWFAGGGLARRHWRQLAARRGGLARRRGVQAAAWQTRRGELAHQSTGQTARRTGRAASPSSSPSGADSSNGAGGGRCHHHAACDAGARRGEGSTATEE